MEGTSFPSCDMKQRDKKVECNSGKRCILLKSLAYIDETMESLQKISKKMSEFVLNIKHEIDL